MKASEATPLCFEHAAEKIDLDERTDSPGRCPRSARAGYDGIAGYTDKCGGVTVSYFGWVQSFQYYKWSLNRVRQELDHVLTQASDQVCKRRMTGKSASEPPRTSEPFGESIVRRYWLGFEFLGHPIDITLTTRPTRRASPNAGIPEGRGITISRRRMTYTSVGNAISWQRRGGLQARGSAWSRQHSHRWQTTK